MFKKTDHYHYRKRLPDGTLLITKVSMGTGEVNGHLWKKILSKQLKTTQEHFNSMI